MTKNKLLLSIVIVNFRTAELTINCLTSLLPELENINAKIVLIDNCSGDDSPFIIKKWLFKHDKTSKVLFVESCNNNGFSSGNNLGIKYIEAEYYLLLNSDTLVTTGSIETMLNTLEKKQDIGLAGPALTYKDGMPQNSCFRFHTPLSELMSAAQTGFIDKLLNAHIVPISYHDQLIHLQWISFACVLIRHEVFEEIGLLDTGYFMYFEDTEFCHRLSKSNWKITFIPESIVIHIHGGSSSLERNVILKKRLARYYYESRTRFFYQAYGFSGLFLANVMWWLGRVISLTRQYLGRKDKKNIDYKWIDIWINFLTPLKKYTYPVSKKTKLSNKI